MKNRPYGIDGCRICHLSVGTTNNGDCSWPLDVRSMTSPLVADVASDVSRSPNIGRLQRQNAVDLRPPSTVEVDQLSRPSAASASRSTGNVSVDKPEVTVKPLSPLLVEPEGVSRSDRRGHVPVSSTSAAANETSTSGTMTLSLPRMTVTAFWNFVLSGTSSCRVTVAATRAPRPSDCAGSSRRRRRTERAKH